MCLTSQAMLFLPHRKFLFALYMAKHCSFDSFKLYLITEVYTEVRCLKYKEDFTFMVTRSPPTCSGVLFML